MRAYICGLLFLLSLQTQAAGEASQTFTLDGQLFRAGTSTPIVDGSVNLKVQILDPSQNCVLYEETQPVNTAATEGFFTVQVGSAVGNAKRSGLDPAQSMATIIQNVTPIPASNAPGKTCAASTYSPVAGDTRYFRIIVTPSSGVADQLTPDMVLDSVPSAIVAESVQGLDRTQILHTNTTAGEVLTQANLETLFTTAAFNNLAPVLAGNYVQSGTGGAGLPAFASAPVSPAAGDIWYDSTGKNLVFSDGTSTHVLGTAGAGLSSVTVDANLTANGVASGTLNAPGTIGLKTKGTAGTYTKVTVDAYGQVTGNALLAESDIPTLVTPGKVSGLAINTGTIGGNAAVNTTGNLQTTHDITAQRFFFYDHAGLGPNYVGMQVPADMTVGGGSSYTLTWPNKVGGANTVLTTDAAGNLSWAAPTSGAYVLKAGDTMTGPLVNNSNSAITALAVTQSGAGYAATFMGGKVGMGTTSPSNLLTVQGSSTAVAVRDATDVSYSELRVMSGSTDQIRAQVQAASIANLVKIGAQSNTDVALTVNDNAVITMKSGGHVGISQGAPAGTLTNSSGLTVDSSGSSVMTSGFDWLGNSGGYVAGFYNAAPGAGGNGLLVKVSGANSNNVAFAVDQGAAEAGSGVSLFRVLGDGTVGIGTASPSSILDINGAQTIEEIAAASRPAVAAGKDFIYADNVSHTLKVSLNGAAYTDLLTTTSGGNYVAKTGDTMTGPLVNNSNSASTALAVAQSGAGYAATFTGGNVGIGTTTPGKSLTLNQRSSSDGFQFTGVGISGPNNGTGFILTMGYNTNNNKQFWLGDPDYLGGSGSFLRVVSIGGKASLDSVLGDNSDRAPLVLGTPDHSPSPSNIILMNDGTNINPSSNVWTNGNFTIGSDWKANGAPTNGLLVEGNVGIGSSSPASALDVNGAQTIREIAAGSAPAASAGKDFIYADNVSHTLKVSLNGAAYADILTGSAASGSYVAKAGDTMTGPFVNNSNSASSALAIAQSGAGYAATFTGGNVGIGTTSPGATLQVDGNSIFNGNMFSRGALSGSAGINNRTMPQSGTAISWNDSGGYGETNISNDNGGGSPAGFRFNIFAGGNYQSTPLTIFGNGNIGIGTTSPSSILDINGAQTIREIASASAPPAAAGKDFIYADNASHTLKASLNGAAYADILTGAAASGSYVAKAGDTMTGPLVNNSNSASTALAVTQSGTGYAATFMGGNVGIGTTTPGSALSVNGSVTASNGTIGDYGYEGTSYVANSTTSAFPSGFAHVSGTNTSGNLNTAAFLSLSSNNTSSIQNRGYFGVVANPGATTYTPTIVIGQQTGNTAYNERLRIDSSGNVGIGTTSPRSNLDVNGAIVSKAATSNASATIDFSSGNLQYTASNCGAFNLNNLKDGGSYMFAVQGTSVATCSFLAYSDGGSTSLTVHMPPDHGSTTSGKHTVYNLAVMGGHVYVAWTPGY